MSEILKRNCLAVIDACWKAPFFDMENPRTCISAIARRTLDIDPLTFVHDKEEKGDVNTLTKLVQAFGFDQEAENEFNTLYFNAHPKSRAQAVEIFEKIVVRVHGPIDEFVAA